MGYLSVNDAVFDRGITLRESLQIFVQFVEQYNARGESSTVALMTDIGIGPGGETCDPAQLYDYLGTAGEVLGDDALTQASRPA